MALQRVNSVELLDEADVGKTINSGQFALANSAPYASGMDSVVYVNGNGLRIGSLDSRRVALPDAPPRGSKDYGYYMMSTTSQSVVRDRPELEWDMKLLNYESLDDFVTANYSVFSLENLTAQNFMGSLCGRTIYNNQEGDFSVQLLPIKGRLAPCVNVMQSPKNGYIPMPSRFRNGEWTHFRYFFEYDGGGAVVNACLEMDRKDVLKQPCTPTFDGNFILFQPVFCNDSTYLSKFSVPYAVTANIVRSSLVEV